jgi:hypothetical protein
MRVGGQVVPISRRFEVLGEAHPEEDAVVKDSILLPDLVPSLQGKRSGVKGLPPVPLPDTVGVG